MRDTRIALFVHLVWATWNREPLLVGEVERRVYRSFEATCAALDVEILALGGVADHIHLLVRLPATLAVAALVKRLKGASSHLVTHEITPDAVFKWQGGYAAFSAGLKQLPALTEYVRHQKQHHAAGTIYPIYEPSTPASESA